MNILFLTNLLPYPLDGGGKINSYTKLKALSLGGHRVDLACFTEEKTPSPEAEQAVLRFCRRVEQVYVPITTADNKGYMMRQALFSLFTPYSLGVYKFYVRGMERCLKKLAETERYDCIYFNCCPVYVYGPLTKKLWPEAKTVMDEHNCETVIMQRRAENSHNPAMKAFLILETRKLGRFEKKALAEMDHTIVLSEPDLEAMRSLLGRDFPHTIIPTGVPDYPVKTDHDTAGEMISILFVGTMTWAPNDLGLIWFLEEVIPLMEAERKPYHLYIVGKNPSETVRKCAGDCPHITLTGYVESVQEYYDKCQFMIVPLFVGSGLRVKIIEAFSHGMPVVSTTVGAEGIRYTDGESILIADDAQNFVKQIDRMRDPALRRSLSENCRKVYDRDHSVEAMARALNGMLDEVVKDFS